MKTRAWFEARFPNVITKEELQAPRARSLGELISNDGYGGAKLIECRRSDGWGDVLIAEIDVGLGQRAVVNDVRTKEYVAISCDLSGLIPFVYPLREDFPQNVPHLNVAPPDTPRSICLYEIAVSEITITYTALRFVERIRWWLAETAYGRLHGEEQPLDPFFHNSGLSIILPDGFRANPTGPYLAKAFSDVSGAPLVLEQANAQETKNLATQSGALATLSILTEPIVHGAIQFLPSNLAELMSAYDALGVDLRPKLHSFLKKLPFDAATRQLIERPMLLVVTSPLVREGHSEAERLVTKAFITKEANTGEAAIALGSLIKAEGQWGPPLKSIEGDLTQVALWVVDVHEPFSREIARRTSGRRPDEGDIRITLIGAGAFGSQFAFATIRSGFGIWTIIDDDFLLPHNLARHALGGFHVAHSKARRTAAEMHKLIPDSVTALHGDVRTSELGAAITGADRIVDASASIAVARRLAHDDKRTAPAASCFMNPRGTDAVVLIEGTSKSPRLDQLEMSYYWRLVVDGSLAGHLSRPVTAMAVGSCRVPSVELPQTRVMTLVGLATETLCHEVWPDDGLISVWRQDGRAVTNFSISGESYLTTKLGDWTAMVRRELLEGVAQARKDADKVETGGILVGSWDRDRKEIYVVGHFDPPPDSVHEPTGFIRGLVGVHKTISQVEESTAGNMTYIGEWHTHPRGYGSTPSSDDAYLLRWVFDALRWSDAPALILIAGDDGYRLVLRDESGRKESVVTLK